MTVPATARVGLARGEDRRRNVFHAMELVRADLEAKLRPQVMIKPNLLSSTNQLAGSHVDALRGTLDFLLSAANPPEEVIIAEGANEKYSGEGYDNFHYRDLAREYPIPLRFVDMHQQTEWQETTVILADETEVGVRMPKLVLDCPCTISLAIAKTHDCCVVTLALKNLIMGTLCKPDRVKMHGFRSRAERVLPTEAQILNINLIRVARYLAPHIAVIDGTQGLQGNGPGGTDAIDFRMAAAGADVFATDAVVAKAMGFEPLELGLFHYARELGMGVVDLERIEVVETPIAAVQAHFKPPQTLDQQMQWQPAPFMHAYLPV